MGEYTRVTREATLNNLNSVVVAAIRNHVAKYELGDVETSALLCCETTSTKQKKGLFGGKAEIMITSVILSPQWLIWATGKENESPSVVSARLRDIQVQDYERSDMYKLMQDTGLTISGLRTDTVEPGSTFIGFGIEPAAQQFRTLLKETVAKI